MFSPPDTSAAERKAAVHSLGRIRAVEAAPGEDGLKAVWHRCAAGADLLSYLDGQGQVLRQEFTLLEDFFLWTRGEGLRTGAVRPEGPRAVSASVAFDALQVPVRILRADAALADYSGQDRFLLHIQEVVRQARPAAQALADEGVDGLPLADVPRPPQRRFPVALVVLAVTVGMVALAAWLT